MKDDRHAMYLDAMLIGAPQPDVLAAVQRWTPEGTSTERSITNPGHRFDKLTFPDGVTIHVTEGGSEWTEADPRGYVRSTEWTEIAVFGFEGDTDIAMNLAAHLAATSSSSEWPIEVRDWLSGEVTFDRLPVEASNRAYFHHLKRLRAMWRYELGFVSVGQDAARGTIYRDRADCCPEIFGLDGVLEWAPAPDFTDDPRMDRSGDWQPITAAQAGMIEYCKRHGLPADPIPAN